MISGGMQDDTNLPPLSIVIASSQRSTCDHEILVQKVYLVLEVLNKGQQIIDITEVSLFYYWAVGLGGGI